ncbi:DNA helicase MCM8 isoform X2 [Rhineura floridana]|nr:DNA helicase MCM8 isoform X2 [Rhineura floridana]XP_061478489.1 DNA helicase MCM8 isoform X2 [Rhineura floridana]XP_061478490.1 DNA helicase MCM8 isoform X2 [Rhineura floridana]XP_061478491.1 DNA helicase MCM8 isoform X2 [Rhineura floridana]XP_061478492.1 DNA helicase MCM8 isoform X2 [Rhineura floridana]XP_061478494.1 DNA helicase MCM8 isoform X2 [Rhineura floridana]XP_061478495.1 DNA helicase MCM8 isoform X2 [Rhineura floridana]XP_061478496.1 DNA helicase MCM8 isoform X2 [Rhineura florid
MSNEPRGKSSGRGGSGFQRWRGKGGWQGRGKGQGHGQRGDWKNVAGKSVSAQPRFIQTTLDQVTPYRGWKLYFSEAYDDNSPFVQKTEAFEKFFMSRIELYDKDEIERKGSILVDYKLLAHDKELVESIPDIASELREMPLKILDCMGLAIHQVLSKDLEKHAAELQEQEGLSVDEEPIINVPYIHARVYNYDPLTQLRNIRANCYGKYIALRGTVVRVSNIKPICTKMAFICSACGNTQSFPLPDGKYTLPTKCPLPECHGRSFTADRSSPYTVTVDWQSIKIQELMSDDQREAGRIPRTIECELIQDLVDSCVPGDVITVTGIVKVSNTEEGASRNKNDKCVFLLYIEANSVSNTKGQKVSNDEHGINHQACMEFSLKDLYAVQEIQAEENLFKLIVNSLCPTIYGHEIVKAGLVLTLFGGCQKYMDDKNRIPIRGDPHVLVVGDPGLGKSQMLQAVCNIAPRGVYVCGNATTTSGLTVTLSRDSSSGDFSLEAGALVLGDQGICGIDEFDKMGNQHQALLEAMEQQSISLAKAGIVCSLPARTSIIAAANPVGGHYNKAKTVSENLKMGSALLSRFDLVFILLDIPNEDHDHLLSEHVMAMRARKQSGCSSVVVTREDSQNSNVSVLEALSDKPLSEKLKVIPGENIDPIPHQLLRKYVGYARQYVHPRLSPEAAQILQEFYLELRQQSQRADSTPITTRQLESLIRLTEARSRLELKEKATKEDAEDVIEIMKYSMLGTYSDEFGKLDFDRSQHGSGMSNRSQAKRFVSALHRIAERTHNNLFEIQQLRQIAKEVNIKVTDFENFIGSLNDQGYFLKKGPRLYQLQTM